MKADNDNLPTTALSRLPLFARDKEIAVAVVGKVNSEYWLAAVLPELERRGFPAIDYLHRARAVPLVMKFYDDYLGVTAGVAMAKPDGEERLGKWSKRAAKSA